MKIGVIADTHLNGWDENFEKLIDRYFHEVDMIIHAGDLIHPEVVDLLQAKKSCLLVAGNMDLPAIKESFPEKLVYEIGGFRLGLIHGWGPPAGIEERIAAEFPRVDCLVYGHSHVGSCRLKEGVLFFNPGSPTERRFAPCNTIGILEITDRITGHLIEIKDK